MKKFGVPAIAVFIILSIVVQFLHTSDLIRFIFSCLSIVPLAGIMGRATESIAAHVGPRLGGLLSATFGNAVELIIGIFALREGLTTLVKASITGSILGNLLLVLGVSFFVGGIKHPIQQFNIRAARSNGAMLVMGVAISFVLPAIFASTEPATSIPISGGVAIVSFLIYMAGLFFALFTHREVFEYIDQTNKESGEEDSLWNLTPAILLLVFSTGLVSLESDWLVETVKPVAHQFGWSDVFIGVIVVAIIGNAAEHASAVWMAWKDRMDLSLEIAVGSSLQVAMFIAPVLFFVSLLVSHPMPLVLSWPEVASLAAAVLLVVTLLMDGESNWLEGAMAVGAYVVMAIGFYALPSLT